MMENRVEALALKWYPSVLAQLLTATITLTILALDTSLSSREFTTRFIVLSLIQTTRWRKLLSIDTKQSPHSLVTKTNLRESEDYKQYGLGSGGLHSCSRNSRTC
jgi:hypothetical protein